MPVNLRNHIVSLFHGRQRAIDRGSERNKTLLVRRGDHHKNAVGPQHPLTEKSGGVAQRTGNVVSIPGLGLIPDIGTHKKGVQPENPAVFGTGVFRKALSR